MNIINLKGWFNLNPPLHTPLTPLFFCIILNLTVFTRDNGDDKEPGEEPAAGLKGHDPPPPP